jgi:nucleoside-diphosphate-sugar epimerase
MKIAVIGGSSRTAGKLVPKLLDGGYEVISLQRSPSSHRSPALSVSHLDLDAPAAREQMRQGLAGTGAAVFLAGDLSDVAVLVGGAGLDEGGDPVVQRVDTVEAAVAAGDDGDLRVRELFRASEVGVTVR